MRKNVQNNGLIYDTLFSSTYLICQDIDVISHISWEVIELFAWDLFEDSPRLLCIICQMIKSELKRSSGNDTLNYAYYFSFFLHLL
jgi:hypothetical protein